MPFEEEDRRVESASFELLLGRGHLDAPGLERLYRLRARRYPLWMEPQEAAARFPEDLELPSAARLRAAFVSTDAHRLIGIGPDRVLLVQLPPWPGYAVVRDHVLDAWGSYRAAVVPVEASRPILVCRFLLSGLGAEAHLLEGLRGLPRAPRLASDPAGRAAGAEVELALAEGHHLTVTPVRGPPGAAPGVLVTETLCPRHHEDLAAALDAAWRKVAWAGDVLSARVRPSESERAHTRASSL